MSENYHNTYIFHDGKPDYPIVKMDFVKIKIAAKTFVAIENKSRQKILLLINSKQPITVSDISDTLKMEHSVVSRHLGILRRAGIVKSNLQKKYVYYIIDEVRIADIIVFVRDVLNLDSSLL